MTKDTTPPWRVKFPEEDKLTRHLKTSLVVACYGNERIADVLDQLMCAASWEAKNKGMAEDQKVVRIKRTYPEILDRLQFPTSRRSLNTYLHQLNEWGYVLSQPYQRDFDIHFENIQVAIDNPPAQPEKSCREGLQEKGGKCANLQPSEDNDKSGKVEDLQPFELEEKVCKCASFSTKVASLHKKVATLSTNVASLSTFQTRLEALEKLVQDHIFGATMITDITTDITVNNIVARRNNALTFTLLTEEDFEDIEKALDKNTLPPPGSDQKGSARPTTTGRNDTPLMPAVLFPAAEGGNHSDASDNMIPDHNVLESPVIDEKQPCVEGSSAIAHPTQDKPPVGEYRASEMPSTTQAVESSSNQATEQPQLGSDESPIATKTTKKRSSKKKPVIDEVTQKRVDHVYDFFDTLKQEVTGKPDVHYSPNDSDNAAIVVWLERNPKPTEEILHEVYLRLWNTPPDKRSNFSWKRNMWIHSVLKQYEVLEMEIADERNKQAKRNVVTPGVKSTFVPPVEEEDDVAFVLPSQLRKRG